MVIATTTKCGSSSAIEGARRQAALAMFQQARGANITVVAVDDGSDAEFLKESVALGVSVSKQTKLGGGFARTESIRKAIELRKSDAEFIVWLEPEKSSMIPHLQHLDAIEPGKFDLVLFWRDSLESYPREEQLMYSFGRVLSEYLFGYALDLFFGPTAIRRSALSYFLSYAGDIEDKGWKAIHVPKYRALKAGIPWTQLRINYSHPSSQVAAEVGNLDMFSKRVEQAHSISWAIISEHQSCKD